MAEIIQQVCKAQQLHLINYSSVSGGDINESFIVATTDGCFFIKLNDASKFPEMFAKEAEGLNALRQATKLKVPEVIAHGIIDATQYLLLECLQKAAPAAGFWTDFAAGLAQLHQSTRPSFGWSSFNYVGSLLQQNDYEESWPQFYANQRIMPLVQQLYDKQLFQNANIKAAENLCNRLAGIFPQEPPALLHGDLWAGNFMAASLEDKTSPCIFDPAVYYGHREMDLGISLLFGGFDAAFYQEYHDVFPLEKDWRRRVSLTQLYPLLVHAVLFGGSYVSRCKEIFKLAW